MRLVEKGDLPAPPLAGGAAHTAALPVLPALDDVPRLTPHTTGGGGIFLSVSGKPPLAPGRESCHILRTIGNNSRTGASLALITVDHLS